VVQPVPVQFKKTHFVPVEHWALDKQVLFAMSCPVQKPRPSVVSPHMHDSSPRQGKFAEEGHL